MRGALLLRTISHLKQGRSSLYPHLIGRLHSTMSAQDLAKAVPALTFPDGHKMPAVGMGCYFGAEGDFTDDDVMPAIKMAIDTGYRHFDTAHIYGTERAVGKAITEKIAEGVVTRPELFLTTKLSYVDMMPDDVKPALQSSLKQLGLGYVDLYLIHMPFAIEKPKSGAPAVLSPGCPLNNNTDHLKTWKALEECVREGLTRSIGFSNFNHKQVQRILDNCTIKPANNQVEIHPYLSNERLMKYCQERGVTLTAYTPLGQPHSSWAKEGWTSPLQEPVLKDLAAKYKKNAGQIALRYQIQRGAAVISKSSNPKRLRENLELFDFELTSDEMAAIAKLNRDDRINNFFPAQEHKDWPFREPF